jgi:hypothetical protein
MDDSKKFWQLPRNLQQPTFTTRDNYLKFCASAIEEYLSSGIAAPDTPTFNSHLSKINSSGTNVIKTPWGGVDVEKHEHPLVEKYLVVQGGRFLAYEKHEQKLETLTVKEGHGVLVYRPVDSNVLEADFITPGYSRTLNPGQEHTIVALSNLLVFESSLDHKGMDKDLIFIFEP